MSGRAAADAALQFDVVIDVIESQFPWWRTRSVFQRPMRGFLVELGPRASYGKPAWTWPPVSRMTHGGGKVFHCGGRFTMDMVFCGTTLDLIRQIVETAQRMRNRQALHVSMGGKYVIEPTNVTRHRVDVAYGVWTLMKGDHA